MKYHIEGEISRITLKGGHRDVHIRLKPAPEYTRRDGDVEKVFAVSDNVDPVRCVLKDAFEKLDIKMPKWRMLLGLLLSCKANRTRIRLEFVSERDENVKPEFENIVGVSAV
mgnify:FL=1